MGRKGGGDGEGGEWATTRRKRGAHAKQVYQELVESKRISIPVVALPFSSLAVEETAAEVKKKQEQKERERERKKAARKRKAEARRAGAADGDEEDDEEEEDVTHHEGVSQLAGNKAQQQASITSNVSHKATKAALAQEGHGLAGLLASFWALIYWLLSLVGLGKASRKAAKKKGPAAAAKAAASAAAPSTPVQATQESAAQQKQAQEATASAGQQKANASGATPQVQQAAQPTAAKQQAPKQEDVKQPASTAVSQAKADTAQKPDAAAAVNKKPSNAPAAPAASAPAKSSKPAPAPPADCDAAWARGRFTVTFSEPGDHHEDVVTSVASAGQLALSAGYDAALKLWHIPPGKAPRCVRNLTGHSGRVEAVCADAGTSRAASSGRDSSLKVWSLGSGAASDGSAGTLLHSHYLYESVRCMDVDWGAGNAVVGAASGKASVFSVESGRRVAALKGHSEEVTAVAWGKAAAPGMMISGCAGGEVRIWDMRAPAREVALLTGLRRRVTSLSLTSDLLVVGDHSSAVKAWDLRAVLAGDAAQAPWRLPNVPVFAGAVVPAVASVNGGAGVVLSTAAGWYTERADALEEAPEDEDVPQSLLNVSTLSSSGRSRYLYTVRMGAGIATCMDVREDVVLVGTTTGALASLQLLRGPANSHPSQGLTEGLCIGVEGTAADESDEEEEEEEGASEEDEE